MVKRIALFFICAHFCVSAFAQVENTIKSQYDEKEMSLGYKAAETVNKQNTPLGWPSRSLNTEFSDKYSKCLAALTDAAKLLNQPSGFLAGNGQLAVDSPDGMRVYSDSGSTIVGDGKSCKYDPKDNLKTTNVGIAQIMKALTKNASDAISIETTGTKYRFNDVSKKRLLTGAYKACEATGFEAQAMAEQLRAALELPSASSGPSSSGAAPGGRR